MTRWLPRRDDPSQAWLLAPLGVGLAMVLLVAGLQLARELGAFGPPIAVYSVVGLVGVVVSSAALGVQLGLWLSWRWR